MDRRLSSAADVALGLAIIRANCCTNAIRPQLRVVLRFNGYLQKVKTQIGEGVRGDAIRYNNEELLPLHRSTFKQVRRLWLGLKLATRLRRHRSLRKCKQTALRKNHGLSITIGWSC